MHYDALTLACMTQELQATLVGGRVQQVVLPGPHSIGMEIYVDRIRRYLLLAAETGAAHVYSPSFKPRRGVEKESPLLLLLRKYVRNATLADAYQPDPAERVLWLEFTHNQHGATSLVIELIGRQSNLLLLNPQGRILACARGVAGTDSRAGEEGGRVLLPGRSYAPPPIQNKLPPRDDGREEYYARLQAVVDAPGRLWKALVEQVAGVSPSQARELAWRAAGDANVHAADAQVLALAQSLQELWGPVGADEPDAERAPGWQPGAVEEAGQIVGYAPYVVHFRGDFVPKASLSEAIEAALAAETQPSAERAAAPVDAYAGLRNQVAGQLGKARKRVERQLAALAADEPPPGAAEQLRAQAEWLLALQSQIQPGATTFAVELGPDSGIAGVGEDGVLRIELRRDKTPVEQAQQMFKQAGKWTRAARIIPQRRVQLEADRAFLDQLATDLALAENQPEIATVQQELYATRLLPPSRKPGLRVASTSAPLRFLAPQGFEVVVGRNARQNEQVTFQVAQAEDVWLHARGVPGAHVIIRSGGQAPEPETLVFAGQIAAYYSQAQGERAAPVIVTRRKHVSRAPGGRKGQVIVRQEETVTVRAELPDGLQRLGEER